MKNVVITAGASGLGLAMTRGFAARGDQVFICDVDAEGLAAVQAEMPSVQTQVCDVSDAAAVAEWFANIADTCDGIDFLINNAGIAGPTARVEDVAPDAWDKTLAVDLSGAFYCCKYAVPLMRGRAGGIINISSTAGIFGYPLRTPYAAAKWGMVGLTKTLAMELGEEGIRANVICPGSLENPRMDGVIRAQAEVAGVDETAIREEYYNQVSMRTFIQPEEIAQTALFLCSEAASKISGQVLSVDGHTETLRSSF